MIYKGKKIIRAVGYIKKGVNVMILQYADRTVEIIKNGVVINGCKK